MATCIVNVLPPLLTSPFYHLLPTLFPVYNYPSHLFNPQPLPTYEDVVER